MKKINYILAAIFCIFLLTACGSKNAIPSPVQIDSLTFSERVPLKYASQFAIDRYDGGYSVIHVADGNSYMIAPEDASIPRLPDGMRIITSGTGNIYLAATAAMSFFDALDATGSIRFSSLPADEWQIDSARAAMTECSMVYAGKYRDPDYELLVHEKCPLSIQSTMIGHTPDVKEKLEELGITVFTDNSSYEQHPLGRVEWVRVYAEILGIADSADEIIARQEEYIPNDISPLGKTVVFFYIDPSGGIYARQKGDYISEMIHLAGGENILGDGKRRTAVSVRTEPEDFYATAKDADIMIYNTSIGGGLDSIDELLGKNASLADFKSVQNGDVWSTSADFYQQTMRSGELIAELNSVFRSAADDGSTIFLSKVTQHGTDK